MTAWKYFKRLDSLNMTQHITLQNFTLNINNFVLQKLNEYKCSFFLHKWGVYVNVLCAKFWDLCACK